MDYIYIDSNQKLAEFCRGVETAQYCAIDTEFIREKTYYPVLALIQIATEQQLGCIDPLVIDDFEPLKVLMQKPDLTKVFHSPSQDIEILFQTFQQVPTPIFDTQLAAAVLGYSHQISYADLVEDICKRVLEKKHTRANWVRRPLSDDELDYAMDDVRYLMPVYRHLKSELESKNRHAWIEKELQAMSAESTYQVDTTQLWKRLKSVKKLKGVELQIASLLCGWREQLAQHKNLPKRWVMKDELIFDIAQLKPVTTAALETVRGANKQFFEAHAEALLDLVKQAISTDPNDFPKHSKARTLTSAEQSIGDCLMALCRDIAEKNNLSLATLATRKDIDKMMISPKNSPLTQGWRFNMVGEQLLDFLYGKSTISIKNGVIETGVEST